MTGDVVVLGLTLWRTIYIFKVDRDARANSKLTALFVSNGGSRSPIPPLVT